MSRPSVGRPVGRRPVLQQRRAAVVLPGLAASLAVAGCGSGGSDGGTPPPVAPPPVVPPPPPPPQVGTLELTVVTTGRDRDPDGYTVTVGDGPAAALPTDGSRTLSRFPVGAHAVAVGGLASNCTAARPTFTVLVFAETVTRDTVTVRCTGPLRDRIVFAAQEWAGERFGYLDVFAIRPDGSDAERITADLQGHDYGPDVSPDGRRLAFAAEYRQVAGPVPTGSRVFVANADGTGLRPLTPDTVPGPRFEGAPAWSPDGTRLAFLSSTAPEALVTVAVDGTDRRVVPVPGSVPSTVAWSPDGGRLAFEGGIGKGITLVNLDGTGLRRVTRDDPDAEDFAPSWSPDGRRLVFGRYDVRTRRWAVVVVGADGTDERTLPVPPNSQAPRWSPLPP